MKKYTIIFFLILLMSCKKTQNNDYSFYYWRTNLTVDSLEQQVLQQSTGDCLYVRFCDMDKQNGRFCSLAPVTIDKHFETDKMIVPVVFITHRTFLGAAQADVQFLAKQIYLFVAHKIKTSSLQVGEELQIDYDWTEQTKRAYFQFLEELKKISGKKISVTLRLHQVKFKRKTGVPPVSKVYLMCYSTSSPLDNSSQNSILNVELLKDYLSNLESYPIENIDIALPVFSWAIIENHLGKHKLINGIISQDLDSPSFEQIGDNKWRVKSDGFYFGFFLNKGFQIKVEEITDKQLSEVTKFLDTKLNTYQIVYYQLNHKFVKHRKLQR